MPLNDYYMPFFIQSHIAVSDGFGGVIWQWVDGAEIMGVYIQNTSTEARIAEATQITSIGTFVTGINVELEDGDVIRRTSDDLYLRITSLPMESPEPAISKFVKYNVEKTVRPT